MAKKVFQNTETDRRVVRYLNDVENPIGLDSIGSYSVERNADGSAWLTAKVWLDVDRFEEPLTENEE